MNPREKKQKKKQKTPEQRRNWRLSGGKIPIKGSFLAKKTKEERMAVATTMVVELGFSWVFLGVFPFDFLSYSC